MLLAVMREVGGEYKVAYKTTRGLIYCLACFETARNNRHKADPRGNGQRGIMLPGILVHCRTTPVKHYLGTLYILTWRGLFASCTPSTGSVSGRKPA